MDALVNLLEPMTVIQDASNIVVWNSLSWTSTLPGGPVGELGVRVGNMATPDLHWSDWVTLTTSPANLASLPSSRYLQWRAPYSMTNDGPVPSVDSVTTNWDAFASTPKSGVLSATATWSAADSPYVISGTLVIAQNVTLTLEPGVELWFRDTALLRVRGGLVSLGTPTQPITLTSWHVGKQPGDWRGVVFDSMAIPTTLDSNDNYVSGSALRHTTVEYAGYGSRYAIDAISTALLVDQSVIRNNAAGGLRSRGGLISHNLVAGNVMTITADLNGMGISNDGGGRIEGNTVRDNRVTSEGWNYAVRGVGIYSSGGRVVNNTVEGNVGENHSYLYGGGIYASGSAVENNVVRDNHLRQVHYAHGGGIYAEGLAGGSTTAVTSNTVSTNTISAQYTAYGGGVFNTADSSVGSNVLTSNSVTSQYQEARGGGLYASGGLVEENQILDNTSSHWAGGVFGENATLRNNRMEGNSAAQAGGVYNSNGALIGNQILDNHATTNGGAVVWVGDQPMSYNTVADNTTAGHTGGVFVESGLPRIYANTFIGNDSYALYNNNGYVNTETVVDARGNWWGTVDYDTLQGLIYDNEDDLDKGFVNVEDPAGPDQTNLAVSQSAPATKAAVGKPFTYTVTIQNSGGAATYVQLQQSLPTTATASAAAPSQGTCSRSGSSYACELGTIASGATAVVTLTVKPGAPGTLTHQVSVRATEPDSDSGDNSASRSDTVYVAPGQLFVFGPTAGLYGASHTFTATTEYAGRASFVGVDDATQGNWGGVYGSDGYALPFWDYGSHTRRSSIF